MKSTHPRLPAAAGALVFLLTLGLATSPANAEAINGAIYTSLADGSSVNANLYDLKTDVYLNGGPNNPPGCNGGDLDDDDYFFQVTDPSGAQLLSTDGIENRKLRVIDGVIAQNLGTHLNGAIGPCGSLAIQLMPYLDTPNGGGVYKVWITRVDDFYAECGAMVDCGLDGFVGGNIKTDNFKVRMDLPPPPELGTVQAIKFYDANANGLWDGGEPTLEGWMMTLESMNQLVSSTQFTGMDGSTTWLDLMPDNDYSVTEGMPIEGNWVHSATIFDGHDGSPINPAAPLTVVAGETTTVAFGNYCTVPSGGRTLGFWSNKNGQKVMNDGGSLAPELALLSSLNLRNAAGANFDPVSYNQFRSWLLGGDAVNMAYMLSVQLAAMELNVEAGYVDGNATYVPFGGTINELMALANASLGSHGYTPDGHPERAYQETLKNYLDELNNGAGVLSPTPCPFSFP